VQRAAVSLAPLPAGIDLERDSRPGLQERLALLGELDGDHILLALAPEQRLVESLRPVILGITTGVDGVALVADGEREEVAQAAVSPGDARQPEHDRPGEALSDLRHRERARFLPPAAPVVSGLEVDMEDPGRRVVDLLPPLGQPARVLEVDLQRWRRKVIA